MDGRHFDTFAKSLAAGATRRRVLQGIGGGVTVAVSTLFAGDRAAAQRGATKRCCRYVCGTVPFQQVFYNRCSRNECPPPDAGCSLTGSFFITRCNEC
jgi:hypothetical protein